MKANFFDINFRELVRKFHLFFVLIIVVVSYRSIFSGFFQQDEWLTFSFHANIKGLYDIFTTSFAPSVGHYQPLNTLLIHGLIALFGLNYLAYALVSVFLHLINVALFYFLLREIFKKENVAFLGSLLFGVTASTYEATYWVLADIGVHLSTFFALFGIFLFFKFLKNRNAKYLFFVFTFEIVSILFKESTIGTFAFLPFVLFLFKPENINSKKYFRIFGVILFVYFVFRLVMIFLPQAYSREVLVTQSQSLKTLIYNMLSFPVKSLVQIFIPYNIMLDLAKVVSNIFPDSIKGHIGTTANDIFVQKRVLEFLNFLIFGLFISLAVFSFSKNRIKDFGKTCLLGLFFVVVNSPIYALTPEKSGVMTIVDSRNLYFTAIGAYIFLFSIMGNLKISMKTYFFIISLLILINIFLLDNKLQPFTEIAMVRKSILNQIKNEYPTLPKRVIFYTESDSSYYGLPEEEHIMPFQSGFGQTLIVWYYLTEKFPSDFITHKYLWEIKDQNYKEAEGRGFGYFRNKELLIKELRSSNLDVRSVISYSWKDKSFALKNTTEEIRRSLAKNE